MDELKCWPTKCRDLVLSVLIKNKKYANDRLNQRWTNLTLICNINKSLPRICCSLLVSVNLLFPTQHNTQITAGIFLPYQSQQTLLL